jgi:hypothetical protein
MAGVAPDDPVVNELFDGEAVEKLLIHEGLPAGLAVSGEVDSSPGREDSLVIKNGGAFASIPGKRLLAETARLANSRNIH